VQVAAEFDNVESIKRAVAKGRDITILPEYAVRTELEMGLLRAITVEGTPLQRTLKLVWNQKRFLLAGDAHFSALYHALSSGAEWAEGLTILRFQRRHQVIEHGHRLHHVGDQGGDDCGIDGLAHDGQIVGAVEHQLSDGRPAESAILVVHGEPASILGNAGHVEHAGRPHAFEHAPHWVCHR
jgi:hypothetical protein